MNPSQKTLRQAVEMADGWDHDLEKDGSPVFYYENQNGYWYLEHPPQPAIDALAAALVRQAVASPAINSCGLKATIMAFASLGESANTINAIVESRVPVRDASCLDSGCSIGGHKPHCDHAT